MVKMCSVNGCNKPAPYRSGYCGAHNYLFKKYGDPLGGGTPKGAALKFFNEVVMAYDGNDCLTWPYARDPKDGRGRFSYKGKIRKPHQVVCELIHGPPPTPEHETSHTCGKGHEGCVTKRHIIWETHADNIRRRKEHGTDNAGERNGMAKITRTDADKIRSLKGIMTQKEIAGQFGITQSLVSRIQSKEIWR